MRGTFEAMSNDFKNLFVHHRALTQGRHAPCYYCGSRAHEIGDCPSKHFRYHPQALEKLGYLSFDSINEVFSDYVSSKKTADRVRENDLEAGMDGPLSLACQGFFEVKGIFQLPFFKNIWDARLDDWQKVRQSRTKKKKKGGLVWMGTDCLRVSDLEQAAAFLQTSLEKYPDDYTPYCALGFLSVEKSAFLTARAFFLKALERAQTNPHKMFIFFLISRLYDLEGYPTEAAEKIKEILTLDPGCGEALYQEVIFRFRDGKESDALSGLLCLIERDRQFFVRALIDPDLGPYGAIVQPALRQYYIRTKEQALDVLRRAGTEFQKSERLLGKEETQEVRSIQGRLGELAINESIFGYLDIIHYGNALIATSRKCIDDCRRGLFEELHGLRRRMNRFLKYVSAYRFKNLIAGVYSDLIALERQIGETKEMADSDDPERFKESLNRPTLLSAGLDTIAEKLERLDTIQLAALFLVKFFKMNLIYLSLVIVLAIVLFPVMVHYLNLVFPKYGIDPGRNMWTYQQTILMVGGICGALLAFFRTILGLEKEQDHLT
jgi:tetratricopeptide (TPR) repeat protein